LAIDDLFIGRMNNADIEFMISHCLFWLLSVPASHVLLSAFAGQILSNLVAMGSDKFANEKLGGRLMGQIDMDKMNTKGGSLSIGHPFGATGSRLVTTASRRLQQEGERFALLAACADGGAGHACLLERYDN
jgi:acetyl-CoA acyltransferase